MLTWHSAIFLTDIFYGRRGFLVLHSHCILRWSFVFFFSCILLANNIESRVSRYVAMIDSDWIESKKKNAHMFTAPDNKIYASFRPFIHQTNWNSSTIRSEKTETINHHRKFHYASFALLLTYVIRGKHEPNWSSPATSQWKIPTQTISCRCVRRVML